MWLKIQKWVAMNMHYSDSLLRKSFYSAAKSRLSWWAPFVFTLDFEPSSGTFQGGPQATMNCDNGSQDNILLGWLIQWLEDCAGLSAVPRSSHSCAAYISSNNHCSSSSIGLAEISGWCPSTHAAPPLFFHRPSFPQLFTLLTSSVSASQRAQPASRTSQMVLEVVQENKM